MFLNNKTIRVRIMLFLYFLVIPLAKTFATNYYSKSTGCAALQTLTNWGTNTNGSGANPASFTAGDVFNIRNCASPSITANWTVTGGSTVIVGDGISSCNFSNPHFLNASNLQVSNLGIYTENSISSITSLTVNDGGTVANNSLVSTSTLIMESGTSGSTISGAGSLGLSGNVTINHIGAGTVGATISCPVSLTTANTTFAVASGTNTTDLTISGILSDFGGAKAITKAGAGIMTLSGANTYSGGLTHAAGTLNINNNAALGTGTFTISANSTIDNTTGGTITTTNPTSWNTAAFTFTGTKPLIMNGAVTMGASPTITTSGASLLTVGGIISGAFNLTKNGTGSITLSAMNTYSGTTTNSAGTMNLSNGDYTPAGVGNFINSGTLNFTKTGTGTTFSNTVSVTNKCRWHPKFFRQINDE
jgi:fibronectin-binding autotransporter adhesin